MCGGPCFPPSRQRPREAFGTCFPSPPGFWLYPSAFPPAPKTIPATQAMDELFIYSWPHEPDPLRIRFFHSFEQTNECGWRPSILPASIFPKSPAPRSQARSQPSELPTRGGNLKESLALKLNQTTDPTIFSLTPKTWGYSLRCLGGGRVVCSIAVPNPTCCSGRWAVPMVVGRVLFHSSPPFFFCVDFVSD